MRGKGGEQRTAQSHDSKIPFSGKEKQVSQLTQTSKQTQNKPYHTFLQLFFIFVH